MPTNRRQARRRGELPRPPASLTAEPALPPGPRRRPPAAILMLLLLLVQVSLSLTVAFLCLVNGPGEVAALAGAGGTVAGLVTVGILYLAGAAATLVLSLGTLRHSMLARAGLMGLEVIYVVVSFFVLPIVGILVAGSALLILLLLLVGPGMRSYLRA